MKMTNDEADVTAIEEQKGSVAMALVVPYLNEYRKLRRRRFYSGWGIIASFFPLVACAWVLGMPLGGASWNPRPVSMPGQRDSMVGGSNPSFGSDCGAVGDGRLRRKGKQKWQSPRPPRWRSENAILRTNRSFL